MPFNWSYKGRGSKFVWNEDVSFLECHDVVTDNSYWSPRLLHFEDGGIVLLWKVDNFQFAKDIIPEAFNLLKTAVRIPDIMCPGKYL